MIRLFRFKVGRLSLFRKQSTSSRLQVLQNAVQITDPLRIRNIGIIAHIDAGMIDNKLTDKFQIRMHHP